MSANKAWDLYLCFTVVLWVLSVCLFSCHLSNEENAEYVVFLSISSLIIKKWPARMHAKSLQRVWLLATLWIVTHQAPLSMGFSRLGYWSELPRPPPRDFLDPGIEAISLTSPALSGRFFTASATWEAQKVAYLSVNTSLAVIVALADSCVKSSSPRQVPDGQERHWGLHTYTGPQEVFQSLNQKGHNWMSFHFKRIMPIFIQYNQMKNSEHKSLMLKIHK